jgi:predicted membrane protein
MNGDARARVTPQLVMGLAVIALGLVFTLDNLEIVDGRDIIRFWPVAVIALGVAQLLQHRAVPRLVAAGTWMFIGTILLLRNLGLVHLHLWDLWPVVMIMIGVNLVWQAMDRRKAPAPDSATSVNALAIMSGIQRRTNTATFRGGELTAVMGGVEVDLRQADVSDGEAVIDVFAFWGGIKLRVPEQWLVVGKVMPLMGGFEDKTRPPKHDATKRLVIRGMAIMGGVEVVN